MPRFYFRLTSKENNIPDYSGKELVSLTDAYEHARALIDKILFHVGHDDADVWKVVISNDQNDAQMIVPFAVSNAVRGQRQGDNVMLTKAVGSGDGACALLRRFNWP